MESAPTPRPPRYAPLPNPGVTENGMEYCNEPLHGPDGETVAYCQILVKRETAKRPRRDHKSRHRIEWR